MVKSVAEGISPPVIRFFGWNPPAVSLGYNQKKADLDIDACRRAGFDVVRRPTGGRAVLHQDEFTYSVIAPESDRLIGGTILETYQSIAAGLLSGLKKLGVAAEMVKSSPPAAATQGISSVLCRRRPVRNFGLRQETDRQRPTENQWSHPATRLIVVILRSKGGFFQLLSRATGSGRHLKGNFRMPA